MGTTGFSTAFSSVFSYNIHPILGGVLAGLGFWPKNERPRHASAETTTHAPTKTKPETQTADTSSRDEQPIASEKQAEPIKQAGVRPVMHALRVVRFVETDLPAANASQMAGRMVISGRMSDVCAELDRLAA